MDGIQATAKSWHHCHYRYHVLLRKIQVIRGLGITTKLQSLYFCYLLEFDKNFSVINLIDCCVKSRNVQHRSFNIDSKKRAKKVKYFVDFNCAIKWIIDWLFTSKLPLFCDRHSNVKFIFELNFLLPVYPVKFKFEIKNQIHPTWFFKIDFSKMKCRRERLKCYQFE